MAFKHSPLAAACETASPVTLDTLVAQEKLDSDIDDIISKLARQLRLDSGNFLKLYHSLEFTNKPDFVVGLLKGMLQARTASSISRNIKMAGFPAHKTLEQFDPSCLQLPSVISWSELCSCNFVKAHENVVLIGNAGTGKTHLGIALGLQASMMGYKVLFYRMVSFMEALNQAKDDNTLKGLYKRIAACDMLILDEMGYTEVNNTGTRLFFDVLSELIYEKRSLIVTSNLALSQWNQVFADQHLAEAVLDRVIHHCYLIQHEGKSYRLTNSIMSKAKPMVRKPLK